MNVLTGTPLLPGVIWYDEVAAGEIAHAVDIVIPGAAIAQYEYVKPAARSGGACGSSYPADGFPYGGRLRLKAGYDTSSFTGTQALVVIRALWSGERVDHRGRHFEVYGDLLARNPQDPPLALDRRLTPAEEAECSSRDVQPEEQCPEAPQAGHGHIVPTDLSACGHVGLTMMTAPPP